MGLLDMNFPGNDTAEGQGLLSAAMSLLSAQKMPGQSSSLANALGQAGQQYMRGTSAARDSMMKQKYMQSQVDENDMQTKIRQATLVRDQLKRAALPNLFGMQGNGALTSPGAYEPSADGMGPTMPQPSTSTGAQPSGQIDYMKALQAGYTPEEIVKLGSLPNLGRQERSYSQDVEGPNGQKILRSFDKYGSAMPGDVSGYIAPQLINQGDKQTFAKPALGASFPMGMSPSNMIALRGQNMTDSRARDLNAISQQANGLKLGEKQDAANLAKAGQVASFDVMLGSLDRLGQHPGLARSVGLTGAFPTMPGSESANFKAELDTFQSQAFLPMVSQLKGMGALSDAEGKKLTAAVGALNPAMGEKAFRESIARITGDMSAARSRLTGGALPAPNPSAKTIVKTGIYNGRKVNQYSDGSTDYAN